MRNSPLIFSLILLFFSMNTSAQVLCIHCYDQNAVISPSANNLLLNGGFENNNCIPQNWFGSSYCPNSNYYNCDIDNWTCTGGGPDTYADIITLNYAQVVEGTDAVYMGSFYSSACNGGDTLCLTSTDCITEGIPQGFPQSGVSYGGPTGLSLEQTVSGLTVGNTYVLEFWAGGETGQSAPGVFAIDVGFGNTFLRNKRTYPLTGIGTRYIVEFNATSSSHTIKFTNWGHICQNCTELIIDDVLLYTVSQLSATVPVCYVGVNENSEAGGLINVFPNPCTDKLNIQTGSNENAGITIYDMISRPQVMKEFNTSAVIYTGDLKAGIYFYEIRYKDGFVSKAKFVKQ